MLIINLAVLLYFYFFSVLVTRFIIRLSDLFVLNVSYHRALSEFNVEPHYPWHLAVIRHLLTLGIVWFFLAQLHITTISFAFFVDLLLFTAVVVFSGVVAAFFWHVTSYRIDKRFHAQAAKQIDRKKVCVIRTHKPVSSERFKLVQQLLYLFAFVLLVLGLYVWLDNFALL